MWPTKKYACVVVDPPWSQTITGKFAKHKAARSMPYPTLTLREIKNLNIGEISTNGAHLWLWTTNQFLRAAFDVIDAWDFKYLNVVTWVKPSGLGAWFVNTTQHCLFAYRGKCEFPLARFRPTHLSAPAGRHSEKPERFYDLVRAISPEPRIDLFNRRIIEGFEGWGDESPNHAGMME